MLDRISIRQKRIGVAVLVAIICLIAVVATLNVRKTTPETDNQFYIKHLQILRNSLDGIQKQNDNQRATSKNNVEVYQAELVDSIGSCRSLEARYENISADKGSQNSKQLEDTVTQTKQLCNDYLGVADYARMLSKSTKQLVEFPAESLRNGSMTQLTDLDAIIGFTLTDLDKLKSNPINDPAVQEYIVNLTGLQKQTQEVRQNPRGLAELRKSVAAQQANLLSGRYYFWNTTIQQNALQKSVDGLIQKFKTAR